MDAGAVVAGPPLYDLLGALQSGTRLKLKWVTFDGQRLPASKSFYFEYFDATLKADCAPTPWEDAGVRCTPQLNSVFYSDDTCSTPLAIAQTQSCAQPPDYVAQFAHNCDTSLGLYVVSHLYRRTTPISAPAKVFAKQENGPCATVSLGEGIAYWNATEVPPGDLAALDVQWGAVQGQGRYRPTYFTSSDGLRGMATPHDEALGMDCFFPTATNKATTRCTMLTQPFPSTFGAEATCGTPALVLDKRCPAPQAFVATRAPLTCDFDQLEVWTTGAALPARSTIYSGSSCQATTLSTTSSGYVGLKRISIPEVARTHAAGPGTIVPIYRDLDGYRFPEFRAYWDQRHAMECFWTQTADAGVRCVPDGNTARSYFSDPLCRSPVSIYEDNPGPDAGCEVSRLPTYALDYAFLPGQCADGVTFRPVTASWNGALYQSNGSACEALPADGISRYLLGPAASPAEFPEGTISIDP